MSQHFLKRQLLKLTILIAQIAIIISLSGCDQISNLNQPQPVKLDGLGALQLLTDKQLSVE